MLSDIEREDVPAVYELGVGNSGRGLILSVHADALDYLTETLPKVKPERVPAGFILPPFKEQRPSWFSWKCPLPVIAIYPEGYDPQAAWNEALQSNTYLEMPQSTHDWQKVAVLSETLEFLFKLVNWGEIQSDHHLPQLLTVQLVNTDRFKSLGATLSKRLMGWVSLPPDDLQKERIEEVMRNAHKHMWGFIDFARDFRIRFWQSKLVSLVVPGDACGLDPEYGSYSLEGGYELTPHNVDGRLQQLTLLMGLAAMHDEARKAGF